MGYWKEVRRVIFVRKENWTDVGSEHVYCTRLRGSANSDLIVAISLSSSKARKTSLELVKVVAGIIG